MYGTEPLYNEVLGITDDILQPGLSYWTKCMKQNLDKTNLDERNPRYNKHNPEAQT